MPVDIDFATLDLMDALDLAILIEMEALDRYKLFAKQLGLGDAGSVFHMMVDNEGKHAADLSKQRQDLFGDADMRVSHDDITDVEAPDITSPRWNMTTLNAFKLCLSSEKKAHAFYDDALAHVTNEDVKKLFVELRDEESEHIALINLAIEKLPESAGYEFEDQDEED